MFAATDALGGISSNDSRATVTFTPVDNLNIRVGAAWVHARYGDFPGASGTGLNPATNLNVSPQARDQKVNVAVSSVYSIGGQNAALVFKGV